MSPSAFAGAPQLIANRRARVTRADVDAYRERQRYWIDDWVAFGGVVEDQVRFDREWAALRSYAAGRGVRIFGDMPIYVADRGADHRAHPHLFLRDVVAGVPPDLFAKTGQLWGNPIYDWAAMRAEAFRWWIERFRRQFELVDLMRIDHFRGFVAFWAVPRANRTAKHGRWRRGPGAAVFHAVEAELGPLDLVAEDLGVITEPVVRLRQELGFPGMVVLQFAAGGGASNPHRPENHQEHSVCYTGTHDNDTAVGWWRSLTPRQRAVLRLDPDDPAWSLIARAWESPAALAITPLQDVLRLGNEARMNLPGTQDGNWTWRYDAGALTNELAAGLRELTERAKRA
jgi:4-alpha-glucanotransferase